MSRIALLMILASINTNVVVLWIAKVINGNKYVILEPLVKWLYCFHLTLTGSVSPKGSGC
jgi:hypothetical protein